VIETMTTWRMIPSGINSPPAEVPRGYHPPSSHCFYHWVDTSAGGLLILEGIIRQVVIVSITGLIPLLVDC
jgi:hypothetical protein